MHVTTALHPNAEQRPEVYIRYVCERKLACMFNPFAFPTLIGFKPIRICDASGKSL